MEAPYWLLWIKNEDVVSEEALIPVVALTCCRYMNQGF